MPSQIPNQPPLKWIWPFEILEQIGVGGMGVVYRARYVVNDRHVALKMIPSEITDKTALARFERELEVLKTLRHPNIVRCFGGACEDTRRFYAMELLEKGSLEDLLQQKKVFPWEEVIVFGIQMCAALECSHEHGVVHRDVKPSNFLIGPNETIKLSDFGLASVNSANKITATGKTAGTFLYMAPEQIRGLEITPRTDLYALGCVLFELVTGTVPFLGETSGATLHMHCSSPPPGIREKVLSCPIPLEKLIHRLLEKNPEHRPQTAKEVADELKQIEKSALMTVVSEYGKNFPTGYADEINKVVVQPKILPASTPFVSKGATQSPGWRVDSPTTLATCGVLLGLSLFLNSMYAFRESPAALWRTQLVQLASNGDGSTRANALASIGTVARHLNRETKTIEPFLRSNDAAVRAEAVTALGNSGTAANRLVPTLISMQKNDSDELVRTAAGFAKDKILSSSPPYRFPMGYLLAGFLVIAACGAFTFALNEFRKR